MTVDENSHEGNDVTFPAGGDIVAQIRAHAAQVRRGEIAADDEVDVWTPTEQAEEVAAPIELPVLRPVPDRDPATAAARSVVVGESLIDGVPLPTVTATYWTTEKPFEPVEVVARPRRSQRKSAPLWVWVTAALLVIFIVSIGIALAVTAKVPLP